MRECIEFKLWKESPDGVKVGGGSEPQGAPAQAIQGPPTDEQDTQDWVSGVPRPIILGIRKPAPNHRPSRLLVHKTLVLLILCILCIDVNKDGLVHPPKQFTIPKWPVF